MIDTFTDSDLPALATMLRGLNIHHMCHAPDRFHDAASDVDLCAFLKDAMAGGSQILLYRTEGVPRGYLMWRLRDQAADPVQIARRHGVLEHIHVAAGWRRRGIARRLIRRFEAEIDGIGCTGWITQVHAFNTASAALMRGAGAEVVVNTFEKREVSGPQP